MVRDGYDSASGRLVINLTGDATPSLDPRALELLGQEARLWEELEAGGPPPWVFGGLVAVLLLLALLER